MIEIQNMTAAELLTLYKSGPEGAAQSVAEQKRRNAAADAEVETDAAAYAARRAPVVELDAEAEAAADREADEKAEADEVERLARRDALLAEAAVERDDELAAPVVEQPAPDVVEADEPGIARLFTDSQKEIIFRWVGEARFIDSLNDIRAELADRAINHLMKVGLDEHGKPFADEGPPYAELTDEFVEEIYLIEGHWQQAAEVFRKTHPSFAFYQEHFSEHDGARC
jgi:hypothetical protein